MFDTKLSFTLYDIIGHIMPGGFVVILTTWLYEVPTPENSLIATTVFIVLSYIIGHLLHAISSWLLQTVSWVPKPISSFFDDLIKKLRHVFLVQVRGTQSSVKDQIKAELLRTRLIKNGSKIDELELYDYCSNIFLESGSTNGRDILESKEAFYRTLIPTIIYSAIVIGMKPPTALFENKLIIATMTILVVEFLYFRREYYRRIKNNQIYKQALIKLRSMKKG